MQVVVVGGGTFGLSAAYELRQRGHMVTVFGTARRLDRTEIPCEDAASTDINKVVRADYGDALLYQELGMKAIEKFRSPEWNGASLKRSGRPLFHECGVAFLTPTAEMNEFERQSKTNLNKRGYPCSAIAPGTLGKRFPALEDMAAKLPHGYFSHRAGFGESGATIAHLADMARAAGVRIVPKAFKSLIRSTSDPSQVLGIETVDGGRHLGTVLIAAGSWSPRALAGFGLDRICKPTGQPVIQLKIPEGMRARYEEARFPVWFADVTNHGFYGFPVNHEGLLKVAQHAAGYVSGGPGSFHAKETVRGDGGVNMTEGGIPVEAVLMYREFLRDHLPELNQLDIFKTRICWYCDTWDGNFVIDAVPSASNLFVATGGSGHGFKFTPALGSVIADIIEGKPSPYKELFKWRESPAGVANADSIRAAPGEDVKVLQDQVMCNVGDLTAEAYSSGRLKAKMEAIRRKKGARL
ncbi:hypothetical protein HK101_000739 [Irineochytrium annulatum]|nr:hypothetical protein HK101_000739 [Irineochytrium annulatum]